MILTKINKNEHYNYSNDENNTIRSTYMSLCVIVKS